VRQATAAAVLGALAAMTVAAPRLGAQAGAVPPPPNVLRGVWEATRVNAQALPMTDRVVGNDGFTHVVRLHGMTIRLQPNGRFQASLRYRRAILTRRERIETAVLETDTWIGTYTVNGTQMRFVPEPRAKQKIQPFDGVRSGRRISVSFDYDIVTRKRYTIELNLDDSIY
jgi:hypothetical protein